jgi:hypothetical protein
VLPSDYARSYPRTMQQSCIPVRSPDLERVMICNDSDMLGSRPCAMGWAPGTLTVQHVGDATGLMVSSTVAAADAGRMLRASTTMATGAGQRTRSGTFEAVRISVRAPGC